MQSLPLFKGNNILDTVNQCVIMVFKWRITTMNEPKTLIEAIKYFSDPDVCLDFVVKAALA